MYELQINSILFEGGILFHFLKTKNFLFNSSKHILFKKNTYYLFTL